MDFVTSVFAFLTMKTKPGKFLFPGKPHNPGVDVAPSREFPSTADAIVEASVLDRRGELWVGDDAGVRRCPTTTISQASVSAADNSQVPASTAPTPGPSATVLPTPRAHVS